MRRGAKAFAAFASCDTVAKETTPGMEHAATIDERETLSFARNGTEGDSLRDLIAVLTPVPKGLRKWSVMRAIRTRRERAGQDIPLKFEADIERAFRRHCAGDSIHGAAPSTAALFFRPKETAGEVWALNADAARAWLDADPFGED